MFRWSEPKVQVNFWHHLLCGVRLSANELYKAVGHFQPNGTKTSLKKRNISCFNKWQNPIWKETTFNLENRRLVLKFFFLRNHCTIIANIRKIVPIQVHILIFQPVTHPLLQRIQGPNIWWEQKKYICIGKIFQNVWGFFLNKTTIPTICVTVYYQASIRIWCKFN